MSPTATTAISAPVAGPITWLLLGLPWPRSRLEEQLEGRVLVELGDALAFEAGLPLQRICEPGRQ